MMTASGVMLFYPNETVYYLLPPNLRIQTGGSGEFAILGILIIATALLTGLTPQTETAKLFELSRDHDVELSFSVFENGAIYRFDHVKIVWTDGKDEIGFIENGKLRKIDKDQIVDVHIWRVEEADRTPHPVKVRIKDLKRISWKHRIVVKYVIDEVDQEFTGTGYDLYLKLRKLDKYMKLTILYYEAR
jgi:hypothetical protein